MYPLSLVVIILRGVEEEGDKGGGVDGWVWTQGFPPPLLLAAASDLNEGFGEASVDKGQQSGGQVVVQQVGAIEHARVDMLVAQSF